MILRTVLPALLLLLTLSVISASGQSSRSAAQSAIDKGNALVSQGNYEQALKYYRTITRESPEYAIALYNIGVCHYELWHTDDAIDFYKRAINERQRRYPRASYALGVALEGEKMFAEAKLAYQETLKADGDYGPAHYRLGVIASGENQVEAAALFFQKAMRQRGAHVAASHNNLGVMLARIGRLPEAEKEFALALRLSNGAFADADHNLALCRRLLVGAKAEVVELRVTNISVN